jgi:formamidopyrimidine-DNA glycosylase
MPELTEVEITRRKLSPLVVGRRILSFETEWSKGVRSLGVRNIAKDIRGRRIRALSRHGKVLFAALSGSPPRTIALHLRMSGRLGVTAALRRPNPIRVRSDTDGSVGNRWVRHRFRLDNGRELIFIDPRKLGRIWYGDPKAFARDPYLGRLGQDAARISAAYFSRAFHNRRGMVKYFLLKQTVFAGIGNIIADESLWRARIHPKRDIASLAAKDLSRLYVAIRYTLSAMLRSGGTTLRDFRHPDGKSGSYQERRQVYGKAGLPCPRCRNLLTRLIVAGRGTTVCARCQAQGIK